MSDLTTLEVVMVPEANTIVLKSKTEMFYYGASIYDIHSG